jgi:RNA-directed DNA polymerase
MSLEPDSVERLRKKLYEKAKQEPDFRFYSLYDKVCWAETLERAYRQAKANAGAAGVDGVRFGDIEAYGVDRWLAELRQELVEETYRPQSVRRVTIPKPGVPSFLVIPDVQITDQEALPSPPIEYWSPEVRGAREQNICVQYTKELLAAVLQYAKQNGGVLPDAAKWVELLPVKNDYLDVSEPEIGLIVYPGGRTNIPEPKVKNRSKRTATETILDLAIGRFSIQNGAFQVASPGAAGLLPR